MRGGGSASLDCAGNILYGKIQVRARGLELQQRDRRGRGRSSENIAEDTGGSADIIGANMTTSITVIIKGRKIILSDELADFIAFSVKLQERDYFGRIETKWHNGRPCDTEKYDRIKHRGIDKGIDNR